MPTSTAPGVNAGSSTANNNSNGGSTALYQEPTFPFPGAFVQEGATQSNLSFVLPVSFSDSFLVRGNTLSKYLRTVNNVTATKFCLVAKYSFIPGTDKFLILSAKPKLFTDFVKKTSEYYLQVEPANDQANQNDCLSYNLTTALYQNATNPEPSFSLTQLCANCTSTVAGGGFRLYFINGEEVPTVTTTNLVLNISGSTANSANGCSESTACVARGYSCCLQGQCVKDGALRPGVTGLPGFDSAQEDVRLNPTRFVVYPQFYFVCESRPAGDGSSSGGTTTDPDYEAAIRLLELKHLYDCVNKVDGEFSYCTLKYPQADQSMGRIFSAADDGYFDDVNFSSLNSNLGNGDRKNNIVKIYYAGQTVYEENKTPLTNGAFVASSDNDDLVKAQGVQLNLPLPPNAKDANLYISYKIDGTCERVSSSMAKCTKTYIQTSSDTASTFWHDSTKTYKLPSYADLSSTASVIVKVSGIVVPEDPSTWSKLENPNRIVFNSSYAIYQNQPIEITYFVKNNAALLIKLRTLAQDKVNSMCTCTSGSKCNLRPVMSTDNTSVVNYECVYTATTTTQPPVNQTVYVSNKNIAHRYFDANGVSYDEDYGTALDQELTAFTYANNDVLKPNNNTRYVGFNEIYGSFAKSGTYVAKPAKKVSVKKDQLYDIVVSSGVFSSCITCGSDYYSSLQKIFPQNFGGQGGGYAPDNYASSRELSSSLYRSDDLLYGRACFVPATMIPWTHVTGSTPRDQRRNRLQAQHFLFANGYNRDWYGFDYGSLIGSFDGVSWFSIGNQRRIKASSTKLYLAVNAYLGDLNVDSNFTVSVSETSSYTSDVPDHDTETDGAQCQRSHFCSNDNDCFRQLGYDYTCQNVSSITTPWPVFDSNGSEVIGGSTRALVSIVGGSNGQSRRCVYRGRGSPCLANLSTATTAATYNGSTATGTLMCSPNNSCVSLDTPDRFNDRIARFGNSPVAQNISQVTATPSDTVGLGARVILRPFDYYGTKSTPAAPLATLQSNNVTALCIPGKDVSTSTTVFELNMKHPTSRTESSDKLYGVGPAARAQLSAKALNACPATDNLGNSVHLIDAPLGTGNINTFTATQNMSSNLLDVAPLRAQNIFSSLDGSQVTRVGYQKNTCLRAPGASCFSDAECAPSSFIATKAKQANLSSLLNPAEIQFWSEELVCGNPDFKIVNGGAKNPVFDLRKNKCCREYGKVLTVETQTENSTHQWCDDTTGTVRVAGLNQNTGTYSRYSRVHTVYDRMTCDRTKIDVTTTTFALSLKASSANLRYDQIKAQYKTLDTLNQRTCCTNHWVRSFSTENGGGHKFEKLKMQIIDKEMFKHVSWGPDKDVATLGTNVDSAFECSPTQYTNGSCEIKNLTPSEQDNYLTWAGTLELIGIPQVAIKTDDQVYKLVTDDQSAAAGVGNPLTNSDGTLVFLPASPATADFIDTTGKNYYSATNYTQMNIGNNGMKKIFSEKEFNCCIPSGQEVTEATTAGQCCTGTIANVNGPRRCCLPDFTDVTLYMNRYVSSEGRGLPDSAYDQYTGYIKDPGQVQLMAAQKSLCCSGQMMTGVAISQLSIPLTGGKYNPPDSASTTRRFNYRTDEVDNNAETGSVGAVFDAGVRWNNHVYCVPQGLKN